MNKQIACQNLNLKNLTRHTSLSVYTSTQNCKPESSGRGIRAKIFHIFFVPISDIQCTIVIFFFSSKHQFSHSQVGSLQQLVGKIQQIHSQVGSLPQLVGELQQIHSQVERTKSLLQSPREIYSASVLSRKRIRLAQV